MRYVLNSPVLTSFGTFCLRPCSLVQARAFVRHGFVSAVGHDATAAWLSEHLGTAVPARRRSVHMQAGDAALVVRLGRRLAEGHVLTVDQLAKASPGFACLERLS